MNIISDISRNHPQPQRIAVVGSGISGASCAWALSRVHDVTLYEAAPRFGGHTATVDIVYDGTPVAVDTGFIVYNTLNYPLLTQLFAHLGVETLESDMSFALSLDNGLLEWNGNSLATVFAQRKNLFSPSFLWMLREVLRFNSQCVKDRDANYCNDMTIGEYLVQRKFTANFRDNYLIPMSAAIWSTPRVKMLDFPARTFIDFFANHRLINQDRPLWRTVKGGSKTYLEKLLAPLEGKAHLGCPVEAVMRDKEGVTICAKGRQPERFDHVVIATHTDQARAMLLDADDAEASVLASVAYAPNRVVLHRDASLMPKNKRAWASWNVLRSSEPGDEQRISLTYWMNKLQSIDPKLPLFVSLNPSHEPAEGMAFGEWMFDHPLFDQAAIAAQKRLHKVQGVRRTWFAGAWSGYGFHEDGLRSGLAIARALHSPAAFDDGLATPAPAAAH
jgi:uncharacterized protein